MTNKPTYEELEKRVKALERDIAEQNKAERSIRESEEMFRALFEQAGRFCMILQPTDSGIPVILDVNEAACLVHGYTRSEMIGRPVVDFDDEEGKRLCVERTKKIMSGKTLVIETNHVRKDGSIFPVSVCANRIQIGSNPPIILTTEHDISDIRKANEQQKLRQAHKMEALGVLTTGIAHEFNDLITPILGYTEMLIGDKSEHDPDLNYLERVQIAGNRAKELVQQMLAYGRQSMSQRESVRLEVMVENTINLIKNTIPPNISIKKEIEVDFPPAWGTPNEIYQVLLNLCINASHSMPEGGELTISLKKVGCQEFTNLEGQKREGNFVGLSVQDTGAGMDQATLDRIFDPFFTTKGVGKGSGLGLSVVQGIVEQHQGHIEVDSKVGRGSTFHVFLPVSKKEVKLPDVKSEPLFTGNERILLVDDEPMIIDLTKRILEDFGYKVTEFLDCVEALKRFTEHPQNFDLVITDYGMPKMNGKQFAESVNKICPEIPIILFTGYSDLVSREDIGTWGMDDLLIKPFKLQELSEVVRRVLGKMSAET